MQCSVRGKEGFPCQKEQGKGQAFLDKFAEISGRIGSEVHLRSLRDAFATIMPLYILAGIAVLINNVVFPLFLTGDALANAQYWGNALTQGTLNISAILLAGVVGYCHAHNMRYERDIACVVVAIASFFVTMPQSVEVAIDDVTGMSSLAASSPRATRAPAASLRPSSLAFLPPSSSSSLPTSTSSRSTWARVCRLRLPTPST